MKSIIRIFIAWSMIACFSPGIAQETNNAEMKPPVLQTGSLEYWFDKMNAADFSYKNFKTEFDNYWRNREKVKGSGYKQVARWLIHQEAYLNPDGSLRLPAEDLENAMQFNSQYANQTITGTWTYGGPDNTIAGRTTAIAFSPHDPQKVYVGAPLGGLWASDNGGVSYYSMNTDNISALGVSAIAVHPDDPNIIFIGTGDRDGWKTRGIGIYKSINGGATWIPKPIDSESNKVVNKIFIYPGNPDIIGAFTSHGYYLSYNGGDSWSRKLVACLRDAEQKPGSPSVLYAASSTSYYKSSDFGATWRLVLPEIGSRIALGVTAANPEKVVMITSRNEGFHHFYVSNNSGESFTLVQSTGIVNERQGSYNLDVVVDPLNENIIYAGLVNFYKSVNGGLTWVEQAPVYADDQHTFEFHPVSHRLFIGNDDGVWYTDNGQDYVRSVSGLNITEIYRMDVAAENPDHVIIGNQDGSTRVSAGGAYYNSIGGDGMTCKFDTTDANFVYGSRQYGYIARSTNGGLGNGSFHSIAGFNINGINQEGNFQTAFLIDYFNPNVMFAGMKDLWGSNNIKTPDPENIYWHKLSDGDFGPESTIEFIEQSRANPQIVYVFNDQQQIFRTDNAYDADPSWTQLENPTQSKGVRFESHPSDQNIVYMVCGKKVYKSVDRGIEWDSIPGNLPDLGMMSIAFMNGSPEGLYVGTTAGVYYKDSTMSDWVPFKTGLPLTQVRDLVINYSTNPPQLYAASFGRGFWKTTVLPAYKPDLVKGSGNAQVSGTTVSCNNGILNSESMVTVNGCSVGYYISPDDAFNTSDYLIGTADAPVMGPGILVQVQLDPVDVALLEPEIPPGSYYVGMLVDHLDEIDESNENNNQWVSPNMVTIPANPSAPVNIQASDGAHFDRVSLTWENNTGEPLYYAVFRHTSNITLFPQQISPETWQTATSFEDYTGTSGQTYYYWVKASRYPDGRRASALSAYNTGWRKLGPPANVQASDGLYPDKIQITWEPAPEADYYQIYREPEGGVLECISGPGWLPFYGNYTFDDTGTGEGTIYTYYVKAALNVAGNRASELSDGDEGWKAFTTAPAANATDGIHTDGISITWNTVNGATHYAVFRSPLSYPFNSLNISGWQTGNSYFDPSVTAGTLYNYWVKAANNPEGLQSTGYGPKDNGFRNFVPPTSVAASDGTYTDHTLISWTNPAGCNYSKVYRSNSESTAESIPISNWIMSNSFSDTTSIPGELYYYFVRAAGNDTLVIITDFSAYNRGYRRIEAPTVAASHGIYADIVLVTWNEVPGASHYRISRSRVENPSVVTNLTTWSSSMNFAFEDHTAVQGQYYNYYVSGATNSSGLRPGIAGSAVGLADGCGNYVDLPDYRTIIFHGTTLDLSGRILNEGPYARTSAGQIAFELELETPDGTPECFLGTIDIPPLDAGGTYNYNFTIDLSTVEGWGLSYGQTWYVVCETSWDNIHCDSDPLDDYNVWDDLPFYYSDALYGVYTIGPESSDFENLTAAIDALHARGISDTVVFHLKPVTFYEKIVINQINGSFPWRIITFRTDPAYSARATIIGTPSPDENYTLKINQSSNLRFENLHLSTAGYGDFASTYGRVIEISNGCSNISIHNNLISANADYSYFNGDNVAIHALNASINNLTISNNQILYGETSIKLTGGNLPENYIQNLTITGNQCEEFHDKAMMLEKIDNLNLSNNLATRDTALYYELTGFYLINIQGCQIKSNQIRLNGNNVNVRGLMMNNIYNEAYEPGIISNNIIALGGQNSRHYGLYMYDFNHCKILHNSINLYGTSSLFSTALLFDCQSTGDALNNTFLNNTVSNGPGGYNIIYNENALNRNLFTDCDYNNLHNTGSWLGMLANNDIESFSEWSTATGFDVNSHSVDPGFVSDTDLHASSQVLNDAGIPCPEVLTDIDGETRSTISPDIGADEYTPEPSDKTLAVEVFLEGLYNGANSMRQAFDENGPHFGPGVADQIVIELHDASGYGNIAYTSPPVNLGTNGQAVITVPGALSGSYYITIRHRNSLATTTAAPVSFSNSNVELNLDHPTKAFGGNLLMMIDGKYVIYGGDVNQDGSVDTADMTPVDNDASAFVTGYLATDVNGDGTIDTGDMTIIDNNAAAFVSSVTP